ncbi:MAG: hypothetical protein AB1349_10665 [Elusimicrobiota bacterium]
MIWGGLFLLVLVLCAIFLHAYDNGLVDARVKRGGVRPTPFNIDEYLEQDRASRHRYFAKRKKAIVVSKNKALAKAKLQDCRNALHKIFVAEPKAPRRKADRRKADRRGTALAWAYVIPTVLVVLGLINDFVK